MFCYIAIVALCALLAHAAPTSNITLLNVDNTAVVNSAPAWASGTCKVKVNLRQECIHDFDKQRYVTTYTTFEITDSNGNPIYNLWGRGIGEECPANEIDVAHIQGPSFQFHWKWTESKTNDKMTIGYDWDDDEHDEDDPSCDNSKAWSESSEGFTSSWWHGCVKGKLKAGSMRTRHTACPFQCSYKHRG